MLLQIRGPLGLRGMLGRLGRIQGAGVYLPGAGVMVRLPVDRCNAQGFYLVKREKAKAPGLNPGLCYHDNQSRKTRRQILMGLHFSI